MRAPSLCLLLLSCLLGTKLIANTYYVATNGSDTASGSSNTPWRTLQHAADTLLPGDTVIVRDGTYEPFVIYNSGTADNWITYRSENLHAARIINSETGYNQEAVLITEAHYIVLDGFYGKADQAQDNLSGGFAAERAHHLKFLNLYAEDCGAAGIGTILCDYVHIIDCVIRGNAKKNPWYTSGISLYQNVTFAGVNDGPGFRNIIRGCRVYENTNMNPDDANFRLNWFQANTDGNGIILDDFEQTQGHLHGGNNPNPPYAYESLIENNLVYDNGGRGIHVFYTKHATVRNNTVWHNNRDTTDLHIGTPGLWRAELSDAFGGDNKWSNNIAVASTDIHMNNSAILVGGTDNDDGAWHNNITYNSAQPGTESVNEDTYSGGVFNGFNNTLGLDPKLNDPLGGDFSLDADSPARNTGSDVLGYHTIDFDGAPRLQGPIIDIGAIEYTDGTDPVPNLQLSAQGAAVFHNSSTSVGNGTDFGLLKPGESDTHTFTIHNNGTAELILPSNAITSDSALYTVTQATQLTLPQGESTTFSVTLTMGAMLDNPATISIASNDSDTPLFAMNVRSSQFNPPATYPAGELHALPGRIQMEDFDQGGNGVGYYDSTPGNQQNSSYRNGEDVDIGTASKDNDATAVHVYTDEWLSYGVYIEHSGSYKIRLRIGSWNSWSNPAPSATFKLNGTDIASITVINSSGWLNTLESDSIELEQGHYQLTIHFDDEPMEADWFEFAYEDPIDGYEAWKDANTLSGPDGEPSADPDGDGLSNLFEYGRGSSPLSADTDRTLITCSLDPNLCVHFTRQTDSSDLLYRLYASSDLLSWTQVATSSAGGATSASASGYSVHESDAGGTTREVSIEPDNIGQAQFFRLQIELE